MLAVGARELADLGRLPTVDRDVERRPGREPRDEACHDREAVGAVRVRELAIGHYMTGHLELFHRDLGFAARGKQENVPVLVTHDGGNGHDERRTELEQESTPT